MIYCVDLKNSEGSWRKDHPPRYKARQLFSRGTRAQQKQCFHHRLWASQVLQELWRRTHSLPRREEPYWYCQIRKHQHSYRLWTVKERWFGDNWTCFVILFEGELALVRSPWKEQEWKVQQYKEKEVGGYCWWTVQGLARRIQRVHELLPKTTVYRRSRL